MSDKSEPQVLEINKILDYQKQAVISRVLLKSDAGNVTLFVFDQGQELSEHTAPFDALVQITDGEMEIRLGGQPYMVSAGHLLVMPANVPHALRAVRASKMILSMLKK